MQGPVTAPFKYLHGADGSEPIKRVRTAQRHRHELLRYLVLASAFAAVALLIAIAFSYTHRL